MKITVFQSAIKCSIPYTDRAVDAILCIEQDDRKLDNTYI